MTTIYQRPHVDLICCDDVCCEEQLHLSEFQCCESFGDVEICEECC